MNILLTGGAGFIGSHTADALIALGHSVRVIDSLEPQVHGPEGRFPTYMHPAAVCIAADVRDAGRLADMLEGIDVVFHFAAHTGVGQSMHEMKRYVDTNCTGTAALLEALLKRGTRSTRLVLASSRAVYGEGAYRCQLHGAVQPARRERARLDAAQFSPRCPHCMGEIAVIPTAEDSALSPVSTYGWTKLQQEQLCRYVSGEIGLETVILRYFNVVGSRQSVTNPYTGILTAFYRCLVNDRPVQLYERGTPIRDFVHVSDVVAANLLAMRVKLDGRTATFNIGSGSFSTIRLLAETLAAACGRPLRCDETNLYRHGDIFACVANLDRARLVLGYTPGKDLYESVREFVEWADSQQAVDTDEQAAAELTRHGFLGGGAADRRS